MASKYSRGSGRKTEAAAEKKRGKKWILWLILLIIILLAALYGLMKFKIVETPQIALLERIGLEVSPRGMSEQMQLKHSSGTRVDSGPTSAEPKPPPLPVEPPPKPKVTKPTPRYYIKVTSCVYDECVEQIKSELKRHKLKYISKRSTHTTQYYELISESDFSLRRAEEKIHLINKYNKMTGFPTLSRIKPDRYKITFGQFPHKENAVRMRSHLAQLYPQVKIRFTLAPRHSNYMVTLIFTGPFSKQTASKLLSKFKENPLFEEAEITTRL